MATRWLASHRGELCLACPPVLVPVWLQNGGWCDFGGWWSDARGGKPADGTVLLLLCPRVAHWLDVQLPRGIITIPEDIIKLNKHSSNSVLGKVTFRWFLIKY